jgi:hypothetical protein
MFAQDEVGAVLTADMLGSWLLCLVSPLPEVRRTAWGPAKL